jgi:hypothetical protein
VCIKARAKTGFWRKLTIFAQVTMIFAYNAPLLTSGRSKAQVLKGRGRILRQHITAGCPRGRKPPKKEKKKGGGEKNAKKKTDQASRHRQLRGSAVSTVDFQSSGRDNASLIFFFFFHFLFSFISVSSPVAPVYREHLAPLQRQFANGGRAAYSTLFS